MQSDGIELTVQRQEKTTTMQRDIPDESASMDTTGNRGRWHCVTRLFYTEPKAI